MHPQPLELTATILFALALVHTFSVKRFQALALRYREGSVGENLFHLLGEVEVVFGFWAGLLILYLAWRIGYAEMIRTIEGLNFTEPAFVFVIMAMAATKPVLTVANRAVTLVASLLPMPRATAYYAAALSIGPLLGSVITEPAAMTVTALLLKENYFDKEVPRWFQYATLGVLFVNVSIGGVLTTFAAPPVLMVARPWSWDNAFMMQHFGWKAITAVFINTTILLGVTHKVLLGLRLSDKPKGRAVPWWLIVVHLGFLAIVVASSHHVVFFMGAFLYFLGVVAVTQEYQEELKLKEALLVGFFLAGLVVLGSFQRWWLMPILPALPETALYLSTTFLTAVMDNALLTYLGTQVPDLSDSLKYALVAGAVTGGGLTVLANAPNPAGFSILRPSFGKEGISPLGLFLYALPPTIVSIICFWFLPY